jgi:hypothetical protein
MTSVNETAVLARRVNEMLRMYMKVQEDLFKPSLRKILRIPGIYRPINYAENLHELEELLRELAEVKAAIRREEPDAASPEGKFLGVLRGYVSLMTSAVEKLEYICSRLKERSRGGAYGKDEYKSDMTSLRGIQKKHLESGVALNELMKTMTRREPFGENSDASTSA